MGRRHGRITKEDILDAGFRRWDGRRRITTDWLNVSNEPELQWSNGNILVYLREPGQSSSGPAFRVHSSRLRKKGCTALIDRCIRRSPLHTSSNCFIDNCPGCGCHPSIRELYIPAPPQSSLAATLDHHTTTRNFFAWIYDIPLVGRALGRSLVALKHRIDTYRPAHVEQNKADIVTFAESQKYLDFRECVDHALATLCFAEALKIDDLWIDAFAHCVGLAHRGLRESVEYEHVSGRSKLLINKSRLDLDYKLSCVSKSVTKFFEDDLSGDLWGLSPAARDHLDRFRSFLHGFYIEQHGFWPPSKFDEEVVQRSVYSGMYSDFRNLYHHLADDQSSTLGQEPDFSSSGGVCTLQNVRTFDVRHEYHPLPHALPMLPSVQSVDAGFRSQTQRRNSWNPLTKRKLEREERNARRMQALIASTNRDWALMNCFLVRRFSDYEVESAIDDLEPIPLAEGRKVRWIAVYAILQTLISVMEAPKQVRNIEGLSYPLCCRAPDILPWQVTSVRQSRADTRPGIQPDISYSHTNTTTETLGRNGLRNTSQERRQTWTALPPPRSSSRDSSATLRPTTSLRRLISKRSNAARDEMPKNRASFCEIYIPGYGNGLNEVEVQMTSPNISSLPKERDNDETYHVPRLPGSNSVSRESSNASSNSTWSKTSTESDSTVPTPGESSAANLVLLEMGDCAAKSSSLGMGQLHVVDQDAGLDSVHFNTKTWDEMLRV